MTKDDGLEKVLSGLPVKNYPAGETLLSAGTKSGRLLILRRGAAVVLKNGVEIAQVAEPGSVFGEIAALLDQPHTADVRTAANSEFYVADASLAGGEPALLHHVSQVLARRLVAVNGIVIDLKSKVKANQSPGTLNNLLAKLEHVLSVGGLSYET
jgi:CRP/FNR family transcriptional regulator, cyclic AMP receptor protein